MDESLKKRLVGAAVLASLAVIFVPMLVDKRVEPPELKPLPSLPEPKPVEFKSRLLKQEIPSPKPLPKPPQPVQEPETPAAPEFVDAEQAPEIPNAAAAPEQEEVPDSTERPEVPSSAQAAPVEPPPARLPLGSWVVQVGSFSSRDNALRLVEKLRDAGLDTMAPEPVQMSGKTLYRVMVGPEIDRTRATALLPKIRQISELQGQVYSYP